MRAKRRYTIDVQSCAACLICGTIPHSKKVKPRRWWRRQGYIKYGCDACANRWRVYLGRNATRGGTSGT